MTVKLVGNDGVVHVRHGEPGAGVNPLWAECAFGPNPLDVNLLIRRSADSADRQVSCLACLSIGDSRVRRESR